MGPLALLDPAAGRWRCPPLPTLSSASPGPLTQSDPVCPPLPAPQGLVRSIGVSNFGVAHLEKLRATATVMPAVNQIELSPFLQWRDLVAYCQARGIVLEVGGRPGGRAGRAPVPLLTCLP